MNNEFETRKIIDEQLRKVGWEVDSNNLRYSKGTRPQKGRNIAISEYPTENGFADYVLFVGTNAVAVIEAKTNYRDVSAVIDCQCKEYSRTLCGVDEIDDFCGYKVPFTFATNGRAYCQQLEIKSGIWFLDLRKLNNTPKALHGWISPLGIVELIERNISVGNEKLKRLSLDLLRDEDGLNLRDYQIEAVQSVEQAIISGQKNILVAMATGTGKTRTVLGMIYRFLKTERFRRILFLVDRNSLGEQAQNVFSDVKLEDLLSLDKIYNVGKLEEKNFSRETRLQVATVQSMVKRVLYDVSSFGVTDFDLIIIDEAHRGYILDRELADEEISFRDQNDYQSKYRSVIEYFDAVKIALTATPALHTTEIFGKPVFKYSYRQAVIDGYLVDHDPPHELETKLSVGGIHYKKGDLITRCAPLTGELTNSELLDDELNFDVDNFNRQVVNENFNRVVLEEIAKYIDPNGLGKTLIFAVDDKHADLVVQILKEIYTAQGVSNDAITKITGSIGDRERVQDAIRRFKNERFPNIVVTVDLLTTGVDVPKIDTLVFMRRRVKSRILFEQMLGRATRLCSDIGKTHFRIFDAVDIYSALEFVSEMKPVVANSSMTFTQLLDELETLDDDKAIRYVVNQIIVRLRRRNLDDTAREFIDTLKTLPAQNAKNFLLSHADFLQEKISHVREFVISEHEDRLTAHERGFGEGKRPQDYLDEFAKFIATNRNEIAALNIVCTRPKDLTRANLKNLLLALSEKDFTEVQLNSAISQLTNVEITADIISLIRRYALGSELVNHADKISNAVKRLKAAHNFSDVELKWLERIEKYLLNETLIDVSSFNETNTAFKQNGGFDRINKVFGGELANILDELNNYLYDDGGNAA